jgi:biphenyl 2,3-dioxygenase ferredoxin subunit/benzene/toluene dioxygenase ferredoxin subunit
LQRIQVPLGDIPADRPIRVECGDIGIVVVRTVEGIRAFEDSCPHAQWRLSDGELIGNVLECPGHGWEFQASTGRCVNVPAYCLKSFRVNVRDDIAEIDVEMPAKARVEHSAHNGQTAL